jgi:hypothetical protein
VLTPGAVLVVGLNAGLIAGLVADPGRRAIQQNG